MKLPHNSRFKVASNWNSKMFSLDQPTLSCLIIIVAAIFSVFVLFSINDNNNLNASALSISSLTAAPNIQADSPSITPVQLFPSPRLVPIPPGVRAILGIPDSPIEQATKQQLTQMQLP